MKLRHLALAAALALPLGARAQPVAQFTPAQRDQIIAIVREALRTDPSILRDAVLALQKSEQSKSDAASSTAIQANHAVIFDQKADPVAGNPRGAVTLVEFFDVRCPYCRQMQPSLAAFLARHHEVRLVLKDLPVLGPPSVLGAKALIAAQAQGGYLKMQDALMGNGVVVNDLTIHRAATAAGLDWAALQSAMASRPTQLRIDANLQLGTLLGIQGTPAFIFGDQLVSGALSMDELGQAVAMLERQK
jgi:protein-disulfide isomerase